MAQLIRNRWLWSILAGLAWAGAFPNANLAGLAWIMPALLLAPGLGQRPKRVFRLGYMGGLTFNLVSLYWLLHMPVPFLPILGWLALCAFLSLYTGLWAWLAWRYFPADLQPVNLSGGNPDKDSAAFEIQGAVEPVNVARKETASAACRGTQSNSSEQESTLALSELLDKFLSAGLLKRAVWALWVAVLWVAIEMVRVRFLSGFPWILLGVSQINVTPVAQLASLTGVYGVSFLVVWTGASLFCAATVIARHPRRQWAWAMDLVLPMAGAALAVAYGFYHVASYRLPARSLKVALIQPGIPQTVKWDKDANKIAFQSILDLSEAALALKPDVVIWPEAALPGLLRYDEETYHAVTGLARRHGTWLVTGSEDVEPKQPGVPDSLYDVFNSAFLVGPDGRLMEKYDKRRLVIFGEYVPLVDYLPFLQWFTPIKGGFTAGRKPANFVMEEPAAIIAMLICFEDVFPVQARMNVEAGTDLMLNVTNDGWFGNSAEQWQHANTAGFRAIELGLPLVRCTNNGITCWFDPLGRMNGLVSRDPEDIYGPGFRCLEVPLFGELAASHPTLYRRYGNWFGWLCVAITCVFLGRDWLKGGGLGRLKARLRKQN